MSNDPKGQSTITQSFNFHCPIHQEHRTPDSEEVPETIEQLDSYYFAYGFVSNVFRCRLRKSNRMAAVKVMRGISDNQAVRCRFLRNITKLVAQWQKLEHQNIMPCYGITLDFGPLPGMILPLCAKGSILKYIKNNPSVDKLELLAQVSNGIAYLHSAGIVHADIRAANIMINDAGVPLVMDQGLTLFISHAEFTIANSCGSCRWIAPEILDPVEDYNIALEEPLSEDPEYHDYERSLFTPMSDVYSLGMTILEVMTEELPYSHIRYDTVVITVVGRGDLPRRPTNFSDGLWSLLESCWNRIPKERVTAEMVVSWLDVLRFTAV